LGQQPRSRRATGGEIIAGIPELWPGRAAGALVVRGGRRRGGQAAGWREEPGGKGGLVLPGSSMRVKMWWQKQ
jgi:hypothetical protein